MRVGPRFAAACMTAALGPAFAGCYEYRPLTGAAAPVGVPVALEISDAGRSDLASRFGPGLVEVEGKLVSADQNEFVINVDRVSQINAGSSEWSGELVHLARSDVAMVEQRSLNATRTTLLVLGLVAGATLVGRGGLIGSPSSDSPSGPSQASNRIPVGVVFP